MEKLKVFCFLFIVVTITVLIAGTIGALAQQPTLKEVVKGEQSAKKVEKKAQPAGPADEFDRGTPRSSVQGFLMATGEGDYRRAAEYLDLRRHPKRRQVKDGPRLARELKIVIDQTLWIDLDDLSTDPKGQADDGLPTYRDRVARIKTDKKTYDILLQRVPRGDGVRIWKFSSVTVAQIPQLYAIFGYGYIGDILPAVLLDFEIFGVKGWWWIAAIILYTLAFFAAMVITKATVRFFHAWVPKLIPLERILKGPVLILLFELIARTGINLLGPSPVVRALMSGHTLTAIAIAWGVVLLLDLFRERLAEKYRRMNRAHLIVLLPPAFTAAKVAVLIVTVIAWLNNIGFNVTTLLAGLGVGGLAVALAAQKSLENLIGGITLYAAQPVRVGDFCRFGDKVGTVEEIGLRATRLRTLDRTVISVPNAEFANIHIDNFTKRDKIWFHPRLSLRYDTSPDQIRYILVEIQKLLYAHPKVESDSASVRFMEFGTSSIDLDIFAYVPVIDYGEFKEIAEDLNLRIMDIIAKAGSRLALPAQIELQETGAGPDEQRARAAEQEVQTWRAQNTLYLLKFPQEKITELSDTLDYPPKGSPLALAGT